MSSNMLSQYLEEAENHIREAEESISKAEDSERSGKSSDAANQYNLGGRQCFLAAVKFETAILY